MQLSLKLYCSIITIFIIKKSRGQKTLKDYFLRKMKFHYFFEVNTEENFNNRL